MDMTKNDTLQLRNAHVGRSVALYFKDDPMKIVMAKGQYMYDESETRILDCINNVAHVGHCHPDVVMAASRQMALLSTNSRFLHDNIGLLAEQLTSKMPAALSVCYFVNSGTEATELAIRLARAHTKSKDMIVLDHAYHGNSTTAMALSPYKFNGDRGAGQEDWVHVVPSPDTYNGRYTRHDNDGGDLGLKYAAEVQVALQAAASRGRRVAGFLAESIQSCAGQIAMPANFLRQSYKYVREAGGVCIADEVQVGFGRVGSHWWAFQLDGEDVVPDIVTLGKPMGNGHPISAVVTTPEIAASFQETAPEYFNTFGGNPVSCAIALAVLNVIESEKLMSNALRVESHMWDRLNSLRERHPLIGDVRGNGMCFGLELVASQTTREPAASAARLVLRKMRQRAVLLSVDGPRSNVLKFKPPMCFTTADVDTLAASLDGVLTDVEAGGHFEGVATEAGTATGTATEVEQGSEQSAQFGYDNPLLPRLVASQEQIATA